MARTQSSSSKSRSSKKKSKKGGGGDEGPLKPVVKRDLADQARQKYLNYALSVITSRAIPDVRDGLKPVHRRILYTMFNDLHLTHDSRHRKSAKVVGDVIGKYHPHGDTAVYDAMVRLAQDFATRMPLVDGQGNFGSIDGDSPAAYRYTEARLTDIAAQLLIELRSKTVDYRDTYDGTSREPVVLPARYPQILVNGGTGIAVGMATAIPPHNLVEVVKAAIMLIDKPDTGLRGLMRVLKGPDFPTGGRLVATREDLAKVYETGRGSLKLQGTWKVETLKSGPEVLVIESVPYGVEKAALVEEIGDLVINKKLPSIVGIQDLSTNDIRVELELSPKSQIEPELIMAFLYKHTRMQVSVKVDLTCLTPSETSDVAVPARLSLKQILRYFLDFRFKTVTRRFEHELAELEKRIHILEGFEIIFNDLDRAIRIIRKSEGKQDAAKKLMKEFGIDDLQADAVLETKLYKLAKLEIDNIREELEDKRTQAGKIRVILKSQKKLWGVVRSELEEVSEKYGDKRRTAIDAETGIEEFTAESFIVVEDAYVLLTKAGWIKRQRALNLETTRMRDGDKPLAVVAGSTRECIVLFSNRGSAYVMRINDVPQSAGHGTPVQKMFKLKDGEQIIAAVGTDPRVMEEFAYDKPTLGEDYEEPYPHFLAVTKGGLSLRFTLWPHREPSNTRGRLFGKLKTGDEFVSVFKVYAEDDVCALTKKSRVLCCNSMDINMLGGPGKGVQMIKVETGDEVITAFKRKSEVILHRSSGGKAKLKPTDRTLSSRAGKGRAVFTRGIVKEVEFAPLKVVELPEAGDEATKKKSKK